jgi:membrane complex biogenesis BtpA family protein
VSHDFATHPRRDNRPALVGMVHLLPTPGSPNWGGSMKVLLDAAERDADLLAANGCDALLVENMADMPYLRGEVPAEVVATMALATERVLARGLPTGIQVLAGANRQALGIAAATGAHFIRVEAFAYAHVADEGWMDACAGPLTRARAQVYPSVALWTDVQKKHAAHTITADISLADLSHGHAYCGADALIITGSSTGHRTSPEQVRTAQTAGLPVVVGSGITDENAAEFSHADALIVGSWLKVDGRWQNQVDPSRVQALRRCIDSA